MKLWSRIWEYVVALGRILGGKFTLHGNEEEEASPGKPKQDSGRAVKNVFSTLIAGLAAVVPLLGTIWLLVIIYRVLLKIGVATIRSLVRGLDYIRFSTSKSSSVKAWEESLPLDDNSLWFLVPVLLLLAVGAAVRMTPGRALLNWFDHAITRIPILGFVYSTLKQGVDSFRNLGGPRKFKGVAYVEYPSPGCRLMGFVTGNFHDAQTGKNVTSIFIPTSPNPMTGFVVIVDDDKIMQSDLGVEKATKLILSAGLVSPELSPQDGQDSKIPEKEEE